jgi:hypothetical protein
LSDGAQQVLRRVFLVNLLLAFALDYYYFLLNGNDRLFPLIIPLLLFVSPLVFLLYILDVISLQSFKDILVSILSLIPPGVLRRVLIEIILIFLLPPLLSLIESVVIVSIPAPSAPVLVALFIHHDKPLLFHHL